MIAVAEAAVQASVPLTGQRRL